VRGRLERIEEKRRTQATAEQVVSWPRKEQRATVEDDRLPPKFADEELSAEIIRINRPLGFQEAKPADEGCIWRRILGGDLARASSNLQAMHWNAPHAQMHFRIVGTSKAFHSEALSRNSQLDTSIYDALLPACRGGCGQNDSAG